MVNDNNNDGHRSMGDLYKLTYEPGELKKRFYHRVMHPKDADSIANTCSEDSDQIAPLGAVGSGSALFAQTNLSENLGSLG